MLLQISADIHTNIYWNTENTWITEILHEILMLSNPLYGFFVKNLNILNQNQPKNKYQILAFI